MSYILYHTTHGPMAYVEAPAHNATLNSDELAIPCEENADVNDAERWHDAAAFMVETGAIAPAVDAARPIALALLREKRKSVEYGGFLFNGQRWDSEQKDELRLNSAIKMFEMTGMPEFPGWKVAEGTYVTATMQLLQGAALSLMQHYAAAFSVEAAKTAEIMNQETPEAVSAWLKNSLNQGWPGQEAP